MGQTAFYFLPVILGYTSAKAFKLNPFVGMILGATLVIPELAANLSGGELMYTMFSGTIFETPVYNTFFGIPILFPSSGYQYSVIPIILITYIGSKVERVVKKVVPGVLAHNLNSFLTIFKNKIKRTKSISSTSHGFRNFLYYRTCNIWI